MIGREEAKTVGLGAWVGIVLVGAFAAGAFLAPRDGAPRIGRVRLEELAMEHIEAALAQDGSPEQSVSDRTRAWAVGLEAALAGVAEERGVVLLPAEAVAAGAPDYTDEVRRRLENATRDAAP